MKINSIPSFQANMNKLYRPVKKEMTDYVMQNNSYSYSELGDILSKHADNITFKDMSELQKSGNKTIAYTESPLEIGHESDYYTISVLPQTIYLDLPKYTSYEDKVLFLDLLLHECVHALQQVADDRKATYNVIIKHIESGYDQVTGVTRSGIFNDVEDFIDSVYEIMFDTGEVELVENKKADELFEKSFNKNMNETIQIALKTILDEHENLNKDFALDFIAHQANLETEAYRKATQSTKELFSIEGKTNWDILADIYCATAKNASYLKHN